MLKEELSSNEAHVRSPPGDSIKVLLVEDDTSLRSLITNVLETAGYETTALKDGIAATQKLLTERPHIVLLDIGIPFIDGWQILKSLDGRRLPAVIVISARGDERDKIRALDMGADDYLTKPFGAQELLARIRAVLRRIERESPKAQSIRVKDVHVDFHLKTVFKGGVEVRLSPTEWVLLSELAEHAGEILEQKELLRRVWGSQYVGERSYLRTFILRLRRKLEDEPSTPTVIETIGRTGYRFAVNPQ